MSRETGMPLQVCIDRIAEDLSVGRVTIDFDEKNNRFRLVPCRLAFNLWEACQIAQGVH
jgi:hypothetical protein